MVVPNSEFCDNLLRAKDMERDYRRRITPRSATFYSDCARFLREEGRMTRLILFAALVLLSGCARAEDQETEAEAEYAPIGPGSDSSALIPPDTPESRTGEEPRQIPPNRDSTPR